MYRRVRSPDRKSNIPINTTLAAKQQKTQPVNEPKSELSDPKFNFDLSNIPISSPDRSSPQPPKINPKLVNKKLLNQSERETKPKNPASAIQTVSSSLPVQPKQKTGSNTEILTITDRKALIRTEPPNLKSTGQIIPINSQVEILDTASRKNRAYVLVQDVMPEGIFGPPILWGWTAKSNLGKFDLTYATTFEDRSRKGKEFTTAKTKKLHYEKDTKAKKSFFKAHKARSLDKNFARVNKGTAIVNPDSGKLVGAVDKTIEVLIVETQIHTQEIGNKGKKKKQTYLKIMDFDGNESWVLKTRKNVKILNSRIMERELVVGSRLDNLRKQPEKHAKVLAALQEVYGKKVKDLLASKEYTANQQELLGKAHEFLQSTNKPQYPTLKISLRARQQGEMKLNEDLIARLDLFYKFLYHSKLIWGAPRGGSGARSSKIAHRNATSWTIAPRSGALNSAAKRLRFAKELIAINGRDDDGNQWATTNQVKRLKSALQSEDSEFKDREITAVIQGIRSRVKLKSAICAEGYPTGDSRRRPNIRRGGISNHCGGEAYDVTFPFVFNYFDPLLMLLL